MVGVSKFSWVGVLLGSALVVAACGASNPADLDPPLETWPEQRGLVYDWIGEGDVATADLIQNGVWDLPRFDPVELDDPPSWTEDPYDENYWRFVFYGLRPLRHLLGAYESTGDITYLETLAELLTSFANARDTSPHLSDPHAAAFRTMVQVASYGALERAGFLDTELEEALRSSIGRDAAFLAEPENYQGGYNHGFTEAAALLLVAETFPDTEGWGDVAKDRLDGLMVEAVDSDGVEVENSPFYHFYVMGFAADIAAWAGLNDIALPAEFSERVNNMADYAAWILMPNNQVPLVGSSITRTVTTASDDSLTNLSAENPHLDFVLSQGASGEAPETNSVLFADSGTAILRSGFGTEESYGNETHIVFDVGPYRTNHSQLDALSVNVHAAGVTVLPDSGLFTYEPGTDFDYFHGTAAHNTVLVDGLDQFEGVVTAVDGLDQSEGTATAVDGLDQSEGTVTAGVSETGDCWSYQSGSHELYPGVSHRRAVVLMGRDLIAVVDLLNAESERKFTQLWHFAPELNVDDQRGTVVASTDAETEVVRIIQAGDDSSLTLSVGDDGTYPGWYSALYEIKMPATVAGYDVHADTARYVTLLSFGPAAQEDAALFETSGSGDNVVLTVFGPDTGISVAINGLAGPQESVTVEAERCQASP